MPKPVSGFKYRDIEHPYFWDVVEKSYLYCPSPKTFNDPFDCHVQWKRSFARALATPGLSSERRNALQGILTDFEDRGDPLEVLNPGVFCLTRDLRSALMWSHYARSHEGACFFYRFPTDYFAKRYEEPDAEGFFFVGHSRVHYGDDAFLRWLLKGDLNKPSNGHAENAVVKIMTTKAKKWAYEEEWRIVTGKPGRLYFEPEHLEEITFGLRISKDNEEKLRETARRINPRVKFNRMSIDPGFDYVLTAGSA